MAPTTWTTSKRLSPETLKRWQELSTTLETWDTVHSSNVVRFQMCPLRRLSVVSRLAALGSTLNDSGHAAVPHRDTNDGLVQAVLENLPCSSKFRVYEPEADVRSSCPFVLIVTTGAHPHPVPLPTKTPSHIRSKLMGLLNDLEDDLADLTARGFLRHPIIKTFLAKTFPSLINPTLSDWHVSLANRSHLKAYIRQARELRYPFGTGWGGMSAFVWCLDVH